MGAIQPMNIFLRQEIDRMQHVIARVRATLTDLKLAIDGKWQYEEWCYLICLLLLLKATCALLLNICFTLLPFLSPSFSLFALSHSLPASLFLFFHLFVILLLIITLIASWLHLQGHFTLIYSVCMCSSIAVHCVPQHDCTSVIHSRITTELRGVELCD